MIKLYADENFPLAIVRQLRQIQYDVQPKSSNQVFIFKNISDRGIIWLVNKV